MWSNSRRADGGRRRNRFRSWMDYADAVEADDQVFEAHDVRLVVDGASLEFLDGSTVDYVREGLKQAFKVENPNVDATCGCGESFTVKAEA